MPPPDLRSGSRFTIQDMGKIGNAEHTSIEMSPRRRNARARARRREERGWLAKNGPVTVRKLGEEPDEAGGLSA